jgi:hypothetical protein
MSEHTVHTTDYHAEHPDWPEGYEPGTEQDLQVGTIVYVVIVGTLITITLIMMLKHMYFEANAHESELKSFHHAYGPRVELMEKQQGQLEGYNWKNAQAGSISIPINQAMSLVLDEYQKGEAAPAAAPVAAAAESAEEAAPADASGVETAAAAEETSTEGDAAAHAEPEASGHGEAGH